jgi:hypothetical protein
MNSFAQEQINRHEELKISTNRQLENLNKKFNVQALTNSSTNRISRNYAGTVATSQINGLQTS